MNAPALPPERTVVRPDPLQLLTLRDVRQKTRLGQSTIYRWMKERRFPQQVKLSDGCARWIEGEVDEWIREHVPASSN